MKLQDWKETTRYGRQSAKNCRHNIRQTSIIPSIHFSSLLTAEGLTETRTVAIKSGLPLKAMRSDRPSREGVLWGTRHVCTLSLFLFLLIIDWIRRQSMNGKGTGIHWISGRSSENFDGLADDLALLSHSFNHIQEKT